MIKTAVIGLGIGVEHLEGYLAHPDCEVVGICDLDETKLQNIASKYSVSIVTTDANEILTNKEIDVVSICSYDNLHAEQVIRALENGKHVMVEKPICLYKDEARKIIEAQKKNKKRLTSNLILRTSKRFIKVKKMIKEGLFGEIFYLEGDYIYGRGHKITDGWRGKLDFYSAIYGGGVHVVDLLIWFIEDKVVEVFSYGNRICSKDTNFKYEDCVVSILKFKSGCLGKSVTTLCCIQPHFHSVKIYGTKSTFVNDYKDGIWFRSTDPDGTEVIKDEYKSYMKGDIIPGFIDSILYNKKQYIDEKDIFTTMSVCFAMNESLKSGEPVEVEYLI
ncbi:MAG: Gfo/Idh/MocA family protein [Candidatus Aminicenantaceae bacterium]